MFNKRWKRVVLWSLSVIVVLAIGGLFAANYAVDKIMNSMAEGIDLETEDVVNDSKAEGTKPTVTIVDPTVETTALPTPIPSPVSTSITTSNEVDEPTEVGMDKREIIPGKSVMVESTSTPSPSSTSGYSAQVSTDKAKEIQENVTVKEKADVASIVLGQLSVSDITRLQDLASGGLTLEEKREARSIILDNVSEEQYNELSQIAKKYGVSQGKTRDQVLAEESESE